MHWWSEKEKEYLRQHYPNHSRKQLLDMFNEHFNLAVGIDQLTGALKRYEIRSGRNGHFVKGQKSWNKGKKGFSLGGKETQFKKGHTPHNYLPVGTERESRVGYLEIKVADPNKWRAKHNLIWEEVNGPIPKGHVVIFGDRNRRNFELDNLILISRRQLSFMNRHNLIQKDAELTRSGIIVADIYGKIGELRQKKEGAN